MRNSNQKKSYKLNELIEIIQSQEGLPDNLTTEAQLWDEVFKKMAFIMPEMFLPLIKEIYGKNYDKSVSIKPLATEFIIERFPDKKLKTIRADITMIINDTDIYHFECQINHDSKMILRMINYDIQLALAYSEFDEAGSLHIKFPNSAVLYLQGSDNKLPAQKCIIEYQDGSSYEYILPTIEVQTYSLEDIERKHLSILIPFLPLRYRGKSSNFDDVSTFFNDIIVLLDKEVSLGYLSENNRKNILELLGKSMIRVFYKDDNLIQEVVKMTAPLLKLSFEIEEEVTERVTEEVTERVTEEVTERVTEEVTEKVTKKKSLEKLLKKLLKKSL